MDVHTDDDHDEDYHHDDHGEDDHEEESMAEQYKEYPGLQKIEAFVCFLSGW